MKPQLILKRIDRQSCSSRSNSPRELPRSIDAVEFTGTVQWDTNHPFHLGVLETTGILQTYMLETVGGGSKAYLYPCASFQLHLLDPEQSEPQWSPNNNINNSKSSHEGIGTLCFGHVNQWDESASGTTRPVRQAWGSFEFLPNRPSEIIFFQDESSQILFAKLPGGSPRRCLHTRQGSMERVEASKSKVYCVGRHSSAIMSIAVRADGLVLASAARDGCLRVWRLTDGSMIAQTMFARWRQPRSPGRRNSRECNDFDFAMDIMIPAMRTVKFAGKSGDVAMGCPNGEVRIWSMQGDHDHEGKPLNFVEAKGVVSGKDPISSLALHVPDGNFPAQNEDLNKQISSASNVLDLQALIVIGTTNAKMQVWSKQNLLNDWIHTCSISLSMEGASVVCLDFRADGGLLAVAAAMANSTEEHFTDDSSNTLEKKRKRASDQLYLYDTSSWTCVGSLNFPSQLGSCLFYRPSFSREDKDNPRSCASREKVSSCRLLLVSTSHGPQTHILPEHGLFGYVNEHCGHHQMAPLNSKKDPKTVHWADLNRRASLGSQAQGSKQSLQRRNDHTEVDIEGEGDGSGGCGGSPVQTEMGFRKNFDPFLGLGCDNTNPPSVSSCGKIGKSGLRQLMVNNIRSPRRSPRLRSPQKSLKSGMKRPLQDLHLECAQDNWCFQSLGKTDPCHQQWPSDVKTRMSRCNSKEMRSKLERNLACKGLMSNNITRPKLEPSTRPMRRQRRNSPVPSSPRQKQVTSGASVHFHLVTPPSKSHVKKKIRKEWQDNTNEDVAKDLEDKSSSKATTDALTVVGELKGAPPVVDEKKETQMARSLSAPPSREHMSKKQPAFFANKAPSKEILGPIVGGGKNLSRLKPFSHSRIFQGKENFCGDDLVAAVKACSSKEGLPHTHCKEATPQHTMRKSKSCQGHDNLGTHKIGGRKLDELLVMNDVNEPSKTVPQNAHHQQRICHLGANLDASQLPRENRQNKVELDYPQAFSTTHLMQRLREIESEEFDIAAAIQMAKLKGIALSKEDIEDLRIALQEEKQEKRQCSKLGPAHELEGPKPSARYSPLVKIPDPRSTYDGPFLAARKVRKQIEPKNVDMRTIQPALLDLWDPRERCPQVSSSEHQTSLSAMSWRKSMGSDANEDMAWTQREETCRATASAQAIYDNCLYNHNFEPQCNCCFGEHAAKFP